MPLLINPTFTDGLFYSYANTCYIAAPPVPLSPNGYSVSVNQYYPLVFVATIGLVVPNNLHFIAKP